MCFSARKIANQAIACCTFYGLLGVKMPEMVKLLPVAHELLRKQKITNMASATLGHLLLIIIYVSDPLPTLLFFTA